MMKGLCINLIHFALVNLVVLGAFTTILGGWVVRKIENKDQLSPVEVEIGAELGNKIFRDSKNQCLDFFYR